MEIQLYHFSKEEFGEWWDLMDPRLLFLLDVLRTLHDKQIIISPAKGTLGRHNGPTDKSDHNVDYHGLVLAVDVMPNKVKTVQACETFISKAVSVGFTSIGAYPHWRPSPGFHLGTRRDHVPGHPATWGAIKKRNSEGKIEQVYVSQRHAVSLWGEKFHEVED